jgi:hypothetical protein
MTASIYTHEIMNSLQKHLLFPREIEAAQENTIIIIYILLQMVKSNKIVSLVVPIHMEYLLFLMNLFDNENPDQDSFYLLI